MRAALRHALNLTASRFGRAKNMLMALDLFLDVGGRVRIWPDLLWVREEALVFVGDVKYKRVSLPSMPNADIYQMLAYMVGSGLNSGLLIYPLNEYQSGDKTIEITVDQRCFTIFVKTIDTNGAPASILAGIDRLAQDIELIANDGVA